MTAVVRVSNVTRCECARWRVAQSTRRRGAADGAHPQPAAGFDDVRSPAEVRMLRSVCRRPRRRCRGRRRRPRPPARSCGCSRSGSRQISLRIHGACGISPSAAALAGVTIADQIRPSDPVEMLSGMPGRLTASGVTVPACGPVSQYLDSLRPMRLGEHQRRPVGGERHAVGEVQPVDQRWRRSHRGRRRKRLPRPRASRSAPRKCSR